MALSDMQIACGHESASRQGGKHAHAAQGASARSSRGRNRLCSTDRGRRLCEVIQPKWFADRFILNFCQFPGKHLRTVANGFHANLVKVPGSKSLDKLLGSWILYPILDPGSWDPKSFF